MYHFGPQFNELHEDGRLQLKSVAGMLKKKNV